MSLESDENPAGRPSEAGYGGTAVSSAVEVSVVLPCLNEEKTVASCVGKARRWFDSAGLRGEVIVPMCHRSPSVAHVVSTTQGPQTVGAARELGSASRPGWPSLSSPGSRTMS